MKEAKAKAEEAARKAAQAAAAKAAAKAKPEPEKKKPEEERKKPQEEEPEEKKKPEEAVDAKTAQDMIADVVTPKADLPMVKVQEPTTPPLRKMDAAERLP